MSPLEISRPTNLGTEFLATLSRSGTHIIFSGPPQITIGWQEEKTTAFVKIGTNAPLEEVPLLPDIPVLIGQKTRVKDNVYCIEHPIQLKATESIT